MATKKATPESEEKAVMSPQERMDVLAELSTFDDAVAYMQANYGIVSTDEVEDLIGDGFVYVDKNALVNIPFIIVDHKFGMSPSYNAPYVTVRAVTATNKRVKFVDFGAGFRQEIETFERRSGRTADGMIAKSGLVASQYTVEDANGKEINATTYYLNLV